MTAIHGAARNRAKTPRAGALEGLRTSESGFANRPLFKRFREDRFRRDDQAHDQWPHAHRQVARAQQHVLHVLHGQKQRPKQRRNPVKPKPHIKRNNSMSCGKTGLTCFATSLGRPVVGPYRW